MTCIIIIMSLFALLWTTIMTETLEELTSLTKVDFGFLKEVV
jgi:hypothetical protein